MAIHLDEDDVGESSAERPVEVSSLATLKYGLAFWQNWFNENGVEACGEEDRALLQQFCRNAVSYFRAVLQRQSRSKERELLHAMGSVFYGLQNFVDEVDGPESSLEGVKGDIGAAHELLQKLGDPDEAEVRREPISWIQEALKVGGSQKLGVDINEVPASLLVPHAEKVLLALLNLINNALKCPGVTGVDCVFYFDVENQILECNVLQEGANLPEDFDFEAATQEIEPRGANGNGLRDVARVAELVGGSFRLVEPIYAWFELGVPVGASVEAGREGVRERVSMI